MELHPPHEFESIMHVNCNVNRVHLRMDWVSSSRRLPSWRTRYEAQLLDAGPSLGVMGMLDMGMDTIMGCCCC